MGSQDHFCRKEMTLANRLVSTEDALLFHGNKVETKTRWNTHENIREGCNMFAEIEIRTNSVSLGKKITRALEWCFTFNNIFTKLVIDCSTYLLYKKQYGETIKLIIEWLEIGNKWKIVRLFMKNSGCKSMYFFFFFYFTWNEISFVSVLYQGCYKKSNHRNITQKCSKHPCPCL